VSERCLLCCSDAVASVRQLISMSVTLHVSWCRHLWLLCVNHSQLWDFCCAL